MPQHKHASAPDKSWFLARLKAMGKSQAELAQRMGVDKSAVSRMLDGQRNIKASEVLTLAQVLGVGADEVIAHSQDKGPSPSGFEEMKRAAFDTEEEAIESSPTKKPLPSLFGSMKGTTIVMPGVDLTQPADPDWGKVYED